MNITALYYDYKDKSGEQNNLVNNFVAAGLLYIIEHYFSRWFSYFVLTLCCRNYHTCNFYNDMFHKMFAEWKEWPLQIVVVNNNNYERVPGVREYNMIFTDSYNSFLETEIHTYTADYNTNEYYFIFLQTCDHLIFVEMQKIFEYCWEHYLINCIIQIQTANGRVLIYTYFPFTAKHCGQVEPVLVNEYNGTSLVNEHLFPKKLKNLYGCPLRAALWHVPPHVYLSTDSNNVTHITGGFEGKLLLELAKKLNFSLEIIEPPNGSRRGVVMKNGKLTGALKLLQDRKADLSLGAFQKTIQRSLVTTSTITYYQTVWVVVALSEAYVLTSWEFFLYPFTKSTWFLLAVINIFALGVGTLLRRLFHKSLSKNGDSAALDIIAIAVGMPAQNKPVFQSSRIVNASWMLYSLIIRTIYQALLFHLIRTNVTRNMPQTLDDLVQQNYSLVMVPSAFEILKVLPQFETIKFIRLNTTAEIMPFVYLEQLPLSKAKKTAVAVTLTFQQYYTDANYKANVFKIIPQRIMISKLCIFLTKHSFLYEQFDEVLVKIRGFGIVDFWYEQEVDVTKEIEPVNQLINLTELEILFKFLFFGNIVAIVVFLVEMLYRRFKMNIFIRKLGRVLHVFQFFDKE